MTGRTVSNGRNDGNSADVDFDSILPGKITYTVKWRERGSLTHFFLTCPCCGVALSPGIQALTMICPCCG